MRPLPRPLRPLPRPLWCVRPAWLPTKPARRFWTWHEAYEYAFGYSRVAGLGTKMKVYRDL